MKTDSPDNRATTVRTSSRHWCSADARITLVNRGSNGNKDIVLPRVVSCGGEPIPMKVERKSLILYTYTYTYVRYFDTYFRYTDIEVQLRTFLKN